MTGKGCSLERPLLYPRPQLKLESFHHTVEAGTVVESGVEECNVQVCISVLHYGPHHLEAGQSW